MQLMIAAAPPLRQMACGTLAAHRQRGLPDRKRSAVCPAHAACPCGAVPCCSPARRDRFSPETAAGVVQECRRRRYRHSDRPLPCRRTDGGAGQPPAPVGIALWVHEKCAHTAPGARVLVCTALSGGDIENRLSACCRAFEVRPYRAGFPAPADGLPLPCPTGEGIPLTDEQLAALQTGRQIFFSQELGARYFTYCRGGETRFVLLDDGDTLHRKNRSGRAPGHTRGVC